MAAWLNDGQIGIVCPRGIVTMFDHRNVICRYRIYFRDRTFKETFEWCDDDDQAGYWCFSTTLESEEQYYAFSDPNTAFAFRMRYC